MSSEQKNNINFLKMSGAGNDFIIIDSRKKNIDLSANQIAKISDRKNVGCDQFIVLKKSDKADCLMEIYNSDGSISGACGNATRCVAAILMAEKSCNITNIQTCAGVLQCQKSGEEISVTMTSPKFAKDNFLYEGFEFFLADVGNPHAVCFVEKSLSDEVFFKIGKEVESHEFFAQKTNVEFAKICPDNIIEVRVFERGAGETLACGTGACAVGAIAIKNNFVDGNKITTRFKGGDLKISWNKNQENSPIIMTGGYQKDFSGVLDENLLEIKQLRTK